MAVKLKYRKVGAKALSHSRLELLNTCARKFELEGKLNLRKRATNLTFAYGHGVGEGIQALISGKSLEAAIFEVFAGWEVDIGEVGFESEVRNRKNFLDCIDVVCLFSDYMQGAADNLCGNSQEINFPDWEIAQIKGADGEIRPAVELELAVDCGNDFLYEGHIDLVLKRKDSEKFAVLELKSSGLNRIQPAMYGNSPQPTGYMMALDAALVKKNPEATTSFTVFYLVVQTRKKKFFEFAFEKTPLHRTQWISFIIGNMERISNLEASGLPYPIDFHGCFAFNRACSYYGTCHLPNEVLKGGKEEATFDIEESEADISTSLEAILERQQHLLETYETIQLTELSGTNLFDDMELSGVSDRKMNNAIYFDSIEFD